MQAPAPPPRPAVAGSMTEVYGASRPTRQAIAASLLETVRQALDGSAEDGGSRLGAPQGRQRQGAAQYYAVSPASTAEVAGSTSGEQPQGQSRQKEEQGNGLRSDGASGISAPASQQGASTLTELLHGTEAQHPNHHQLRQQASSSHDSLLADTGEASGLDAEDDQEEECLQGLVDDDGFTPRRRHSSPRVGIPGGPCAHCGAKESPQWRRPLAKKVVLCNACGIYFSRHHSLPRRKKVPGNSSRSAKPASHASGKQSILCDEKLESDELAAQAPAAAVATVQQAQTLLLPQLPPVHTTSSHQQGFATTMAHVYAGMANQPSNGRASLSLPLNVALSMPLNSIVQTFIGALS
ncbi:hypothetical protein TSOC_000606 [Tetrabaena socialis]|uniref:GATA-type domain-containing protein n=1 Tax=Tetrabaena socialis TaxID=47790 RepID=A0A2J8AIV0_9CHLO|nr:hypothetical protein TSOC_000606 [Tetrabaena socialis]|eukprot:PNH12452.1 hypothetical protein TSOC_000606 [Tetrabaena socialis]